MAALRLLVCMTVLLFAVGSNAYRDEDFEEFDEDDAEFDFDVQEDTDGDQEEDSAVVDYGDEDDEEGDEDEEVFDGDEFEGAPPSSRQSPDDLTISESTVQRKPFWQAYLVELVVVACMSLYLLNYLIGRSRNSSLAYSWFEAHRELLETNFTIVGDNGEGDDPTEGEFVKLADDEFVMWSSGRQNCTGMLVHMKLSPRQDLFSLFSGFLQPNGDTVTVIFKLGDEDMDSLVFACGQKRALHRLVKEYEDLHHYTPALKPMARTSGDMFLASESGEVSGCVLNERMLGFIDKHSEEIQSIHITDQYTGVVQETDDSENMVVVKKPENRIHLTLTGCSTDNLLMKFGFQLLDHVKSIRLSKEGRAKAVRNRARVSQSMEKMQHAQRQEAAQQRREDKAKAAKERMLAETDPEKQRKLEEKENKKARKRNQPKMKAMRVATK